MKIAMIGQKGIPSRAGGVEIHVEELAAGLYGEQHEVDVYCRKYYCKDKFKTHRGIRLIYIPTIPTKHLDAIIYTFFATIVALIKGYDIYHYHACGPSSLCWIPKLFGKKVVCTFHGLDWKRAKWGGIGQEYLKFGERIGAKYADEIIVLNKPMEDYFYETYGRTSTIIPNGVVIPEVQDPDEILKRWNLEKDSYLLYLGRLVPEKGIHYLIEAYKKSGIQKKLVIAGGSSHSDDYVEKIIAMTLDEENIILTGFVAGKPLEELFSNAYIYILPSDVEGLPISLLEAMSYKRCCLISDIKENSTTANGRCVEFKRGDIEDLKEKLCMLDQMEFSKIQEIGKQACEYVKYEYTWDKVVEQTIEVYQKLRKG